MPEVHDTFQDELIEAIHSAARDGLTAKDAVYLTLAQAFSLFLHAVEIGDNEPTVEFVRVAHLAALGMVKRMAAAAN